MTFARWSCAAFAGVVFLAALAAHASTFVPGFDPMDSVPGIMALHFLVFPPFIAGMLFSKARSRTSADDLSARAPRWLSVLTTAAMVYAMVNFLVFLILQGGGSPKEEYGRFVLKSHGKVVREITEAEYHDARARVVRGFSGHWMLFASAALLMIVGSRPPGNERA